MSRAEQKLRSRAGASMPLALLFLLFCLMVGAVVLTAATANVGRTARLRQEQQSYLAVQSAVHLLRDELCELEFTGSYTSTTSEIVTTLVGTGGELTNVTTTDGPHYSEPVTTLEGSRFSSLLAADFETLYRAGVPGQSAGAAPSPHGLTLAAGQEPLPDVAAVLELSDSYLLTAALQADGQPASYPLALTLTAGVQEALPTTEVSTSTQNNQLITTYVTTYRTTVTFETARVEKGGTAP